MSSRWGPMGDYLFDIQLNNLPSNKESPRKLIFLHTWKAICSIEITTLHCVGTHALRKAQLEACYSSSLHERPYVKQSPTSFTGTLLGLLRPGGIKHYPYTRMALIPIVRTWDTIPKGYPSRWSYPNPYIPKTIPMSSQCRTIFVQHPTQHVLPIKCHTGQKLATEEHQALCGIVFLKNL